MYNKRLDTFLEAAVCGSFSQASEKLNISPTAVVKQINQLEYDLGLRLFVRTTHGVMLTEAGKALVEESRKLVQASRRAVRRVQSIDAAAQAQIRLGTSLLRSARYFLHLWTEVYGKSLSHRLDIVPFLDNTGEEYRQAMDSLGKTLDVIATAYAPERTSPRCQVLQLTTLPFCCAVPTGHRLRDRQRLAISDLAGETLILLGQGQAHCVDAVRRELGKVEGITLADTEDYLPDTFNRCEATGQLLLTAECWANAHPMLKTVPVNWPFGVPYGLLYPREPAENTRRFIEEIRTNR